MKSNLTALKKTINKLVKAHQPSEPYFTPEELAVFYDAVRETTAPEWQWQWEGLPTYTGELTEEILAKKEKYKQISIEQDKYFAANF